MPFAQVALPSPLRRTFTYSVPDSLGDRVALGVEVQVPFRGRDRRGFVVAVGNENPLPKGADVHPLSAALTPPLFTPHLLALTRWIADYYLAPWGDVLAAA